MRIFADAGVVVLVGTLVLTGTSNAVNLTDGLDGLAAGCAGIVSFTFLILVLIQGYPMGSGGSLADYLFLPHIPGSAGMAVIAGAMVGACLGFLWFNCSPASVFMGDTGSLALGGLIGYIAIVIRQELLLIICGGILWLRQCRSFCRWGGLNLREKGLAWPADIFDVAPAPSFSGTGVEGNADCHPVLADRGNAGDAGFGHD